MNEVITILQAEVDKSKWQLLLDKYDSETKNIPESIKQTFLIQSQSRPQIWCIVTHWRSQADLDKMRATEAEPVAVRIFKSVSASFQLEIWDTHNHHLGPKW